MGPSLENPEPEQPPGFLAPSWGLQKQSAQSGKKKSSEGHSSGENFGSNPRSATVKLDVFRKEICLSYEIYFKIPQAVVWSCLFVLWESCVIAGSQMKEVNERKADSLLILCACAMSAYARVIMKTAQG